MMYYRWVVLTCVLMSAAPGDASIIAVCPSNPRNYPKYHPLNHCRTSPRAQRLYYSPSEIDYLRILETTNTTIVLSWERPKDQMGVISKYVLTYELMERIGCNEIPNSFMYTKNVYHSEISKVILSDLQPYSTYNITVAVHTSSRGNPIEIMGNTTINSDISEEELPKFISISNLTARSVTFSWQVNCLKQTGPLYFQIVLKCVQDESCDQIQDIVLDHINSDMKEFTTYDLTPFTHYSIELRAKRSETEDLTRFSRNTEFYSPESSPPAVRNFTVYSKDKTSVSLRWLNPYPPHGQLEKYVIKYCTTQCGTIEIATNRLAQCDLWHKNFNCYKIGNLDENRTYIIIISAKNKYINQWGPDTLLTMNTTENKSNAPLNLRSKLKNNTIILSWNHPDITNGQLKKFIITVNQTETELENQDERSFYFYKYSVPEEKKTYNYKVLTNNTYQYSSSYIVTVCGVNSFYGENATLLIDTPPETPELKGNVTVEEESTTASTITVIIPGVKKKASFLYVLVSNKNSSNRTNTDEEKDLQGEILQYSNFEHSWIADETIDLNEKEIKIFLGSGKSFNSQHLNKKIVDHKLEPSTAYELTLVLINTYKNERSIQVYHKNIYTAAVSNSYLQLYIYGAIMLLVLPVAVYFLYRFIRKKIIENSYITPPEVPIRNNYLEIIPDEEFNKAFFALNKNQTEEHIYEIPIQIQNPGTRMYNDLVEVHSYESIPNLSKSPSYASMNLLPKEQEHMNM